MPDWLSAGSLRYDWRVLRCEKGRRKAAVFDGGSEDCLMRKFGHRRGRGGRELCGRGGRILIEYGGFVVPDMSKWLSIIVGVVWCDLFWCRHLG